MPHLLDLSDTTWRAMLAEATRALQAGGVQAPRRTAAWMLGAILGCSRAQLFAYPERQATPAQAEALSEMVERRLQDEPLQYVVGHTDFYGLRLRVTPSVLIPRPETEQVVAFALQRVQSVEAPRVLDVGTGSGCIALAVKHERPDAVVEGCDVSDAALEVARANAAALDLDVVFLRADVLAPGFTDRVSGDLDLLISNPPYVPDDEAATLSPEVRDFEPHLALFSGTDPLRFYRAIIRNGPALLRPGGCVVFETHAHHAEAVCEVLQRAGFVEVAWRPDLAGLPRIASGRWPD